MLRSYDPNFLGVIYITELYVIKLRKFHRQCTSRFHLNRYHYIISDEICQIKLNSIDFSSHVICKFLNLVKRKACWNSYTYKSERICYRSWIDCFWTRWNWHCKMRILTKKQTVFVHDLSTLVQSKFSFVHSSKESYHRMKI